MPQHVSTRSNTLQPIVLRYVYVIELEQIGAYWGIATRANLIITSFIDLTRKY